MIAVEHVRELVCAAWTTTLGVDLECREPGLADAPQSGVMASVQIGGAWEGSILIHCSATCANDVAARMFEIEAADVSFEEVKDAIGELANIVGGNFKGMLPGTCHISLPTVVEGTDYLLAVKGVELASSLDFESGGEVVNVRVYGRGNDQEQIG